MSADLALAGSPSGLADTDGRPITDWPSIRQWVLDRAGRQCEICLLRAAADVDHIWPRRLGGDDHVGNLQAACGPCNKSKGARVDRATATDHQVLLAIGALDERIRELSAERHDFEAELIVRAAIDGTEETERAIRQYHLLLGVSLADLADRVERMGQALSRMERAREKAASAGTPTRDEAIP